MYAQAPRVDNVREFRHPVPASPTIDMLVRVPRWTQQWMACPRDWAVAGSSSTPARRGGKGRAVQRPTTIVFQWGSPMTGHRMAQAIRIRMRMPCSGITGGWRIRAWVGGRV